MWALCKFPARGSVRAAGLGEGMGQEGQRPLRRRQTWSSWGDGAFNCRILGVWGCQPPALAPALTQHLLPGSGAMVGRGRTCSSRPLAGILPSSSNPLSLQHHPSGWGQEGWDWRLVPRAASGSNLGGLPGRGGGPRTQHGIPSRACGDSGNGGSCNADRRHGLCAPAWHHCPHPAPAPAEGVTAEAQPGRGGKLPSIPHSWSVAETRSSPGSVWLHSSMENFLDWSVTALSMLSTLHVLSHLFLPATPR